MTRLGADGQLVTDVTHLSNGELLNTRLKNGAVISRVEEIQGNEDNR